MLYKFRSKASGDVLMLQAHGDALLALLGREPAPRGIIEVSAMPAALAALDKAIAESEAVPPGATKAPEAPDDDSPAASRGVGLRQRLWPMIEMLRRCQAEREPIVWGV